MGFNTFIYGRILFFCVQSMRQHAKAKKNCDFCMKIWIFCYSTFGFFLQWWRKTSCHKNMLKKCLPWLNIQSVQNVDGECVACEFPWKAMRNYCAVSLLIAGIFRTHPFPICFDDIVSPAFVYKTTSFLRTLSLAPPHLVVAELCQRKHWIHIFIGTSSLHI